MFVALHVVGLAEELDNSVQASGVHSSCERVGKIVFVIDGKSWIMALRHQYFMFTICRSITTL